MITETLPNVFAKYRLRKMNLTFVRRTRRCSISSMKRERNSQDERCRKNKLTVAEAGLADELDY